MTKPRGAWGPTYLVGEEGLMEIYSELDPQRLARALADAKEELAAKPLDEHPIRALLRRLHRLVCLH